MMFNLIRCPLIQAFHIVACTLQRWFCRWNRWWGGPRLHLSCSDTPWGSKCCPQGIGMEMTQWGCCTMSRCVCQQMRQSKIGWPRKGNCCCQLYWLCNVPMSWKMHCHAWHHMLGWGIPMVLVRLAVWDAVIEVMVLGWLAWVACCWCPGVVASYDPLRSRGWDSVIWLPLLW